jgi:RND superfamily putative drug exporter
VLGPANDPLPGGDGLTISSRGRVARLAVVLDAQPLGAAAIARVRALRRDMGGLLRQAGLGDAHGLVGGDTALAADTISLATGDLARVGPIVLGVVLVLLALYLRAVVVPLALVAASTLGVATALGITGWVWTWLGHAAVTYYVPFAVAVLLLGLGSDYTVLLTGRIWQAAERAPLGEAIAGAGASAGRSIGVAGLVLALSFALMALVPLGEFRQFALAMSAGLLLDAFVIRPLLVPALVDLAGRRGAAPAGPGPVR